MRIILLIWFFGMFVADIVDEHSALDKLNIVIVCMYSAHFNLYEEGHKKSKIPS